MIWKILKAIGGAFVTFGKWVVTAAKWVWGGFKAALVKLGGLIRPLIEKHLAKKVEKFSNKKTFNEDTEQKPKIRNWRYLDNLFYPLEYYLSRTQEVSKYQQSAAEKMKVNYEEQLKSIKEKFISAGCPPEAINTLMNELASVLFYNQPRVKPDRFKEIFERFGGKIPVNEIILAAREVVMQGHSGETNALTQLTFTYPELFNGKKIELPDDAESFLEKNPDPKSLNKSKIVKQLRAVMFDIFFKDGEEQTTEDYNLNEFFSKENIEFFKKSSSVINTLSQVAKENINIAKTIIDAAYKNFKTLEKDWEGWVKHLETWKTEGLNDGFVPEADQNLQEFRFSQYGYGVEIDENNNEKINYDKILSWSVGEHQLVKDSNMFTILVAKMTIEFYLNYNQITVKLFKDIYDVLKATANAE